MLTAVQVLDVACVLTILKGEHGIDPDPAFGPLKAADFRFIAECINANWNTYDTARNLAAKVKGRS
jgi:hypothetical protein